MPETEPPRLETPGELLGRIDRIKDVLSRRATGSGSPGDDVEYQELRAHLRTHEEVGSLMPQWLKSIRSLDDWWGFIKGRFRS